MDHDLMGVPRSSSTSTGEGALAISTLAYPPTHTLTLLKRGGGEREKSWEEKKIK